MLLSANPADAITNTGQIRYVIKEGAGAYSMWPTGRATADRCRRPWNRSALPFVFSGEGVCQVRRATRRAVLAVVVAVFLLLLGSGPAIRYLHARDLPAEAGKLAAALGIQPGMTVAEIGAGTGAMAVEMARIVGRDGEVIATELDEHNLAAIRDAAGRAKLPNVSVLAAAEHTTNLPIGCCDAIYMQRVYHHLTDPAGVIASARQALKPGGRLAVIDFEPNVIRNLTTPRGVPDRGGHGVPKDALVREMRSFRLALRGDLIDWPDGEYLGVFVATTAGSRSRPRTMRELPVLALAFGRSFSPC